MAPMTAATRTSRVNPSAGQPAIEKPRSNWSPTQARSRKRAALRTSPKRPKVTSRTGRLRSLRTGFRYELMAPKTRGRARRLTKFDSSFQSRAGPPATVTHRAMALTTRRASWLMGPSYRPRPRVRWAHLSLRLRRSPRARQPAAPHRRPAAGPPDGLRPGAACPARRPVRGPADVGHADGFPRLRRPLAGRVGGRTARPAWPL